MKRLWLILFVIIGCASNQYTERDDPNKGWQKGLPRREDVKLYLLNGSEWSGVISEYNSSERNMEFYVMQVDGITVQQEMIELNYDKVTKIAHYTDKGIEIIEPKDFDSYRWYIKSADSHEAKAQQSKQQTSNCLSAIGLLALIGAAAYVASESTEGGGGSSDYSSPSSSFGTGGNKGCHIYGKIKFVEYGEDYKVKFVDFGENLKIKYVEYGEDSIGNWKMVEYGEDYKIKIVSYGEDLTVKTVSYGQGCN